MLRLISNLSGLLRHIATGFGAKSCTIVVRTDHAAVEPRMLRLSRDFVIRIKGLYLVMLILL